MIVVPEVVLSGFCYQKMNEASEFSKIATQELVNVSFNKTIVISMIEKCYNNFFNNLKVFLYETIIHKQLKSKLFKLGDENIYFTAGDESEICKFEINGINCAALNCFELRFTELWNLIRGLDIIFVIAQWDIIVGY